jgi:hypothetical protein
METQNRDELIGRIYRHKTEHRKRLAYIDAELRNAVELFQTAASQLQCLLAGERSDLEPALAKLDVNRVVKLVAEREQLYRRIADANQQLKQLGVR